MRILHVTPYYEHAWAYGGIPRVVTAMARGLAGRGHQVTVCTTDVAGPRSRLAGSGRARSHGVDVLDFKNVSNLAAYELQLFMPVGLLTFLHRSASTFDVAHLHGCHNVPGAMASMALRRARVPYLLQPHGTAPLLERRRALKWIFGQTLGREVMPGARATIAVTAAERAQLVALGRSAATIRVLPNPLDLSEFSRPMVPGAFRRRLGIDAREIVLYLGKLTPRKRVEDLVAGFATLGRSSATLVIAGNDMGSEPALRRLVATLGLGERARFTGLLEADARLEALTDASVLVYPARDEIFGLVPVEALLCGTPVVVADDSGCGEVIAATGGGRIVAQGDVGAIARAIADILDAPDRWRAAAAVAATRARGLFDSQAVCGRLEALYREVVAG